MITAVILGVTSLYWLGVWCLVETRTQVRRWQNRGLKRLPAPKPKAWTTLVVISPGKAD